MPTEPRAQHPFYMHEAILKQPEGFAHAVRRVIEQLATSISSCERLFLVGIATSYSNSHTGEVQRIFLFFTM
ncbi:MAG: hypothetical protein BRC38_00540 [Cyanobacteria bacterium QH_6_48_35]|jgi:glucosamine 6-phosphate synthetase-like amidotransferase/phosphosugar isomerase protein|nr:MAG: hypothetical protein BRC39_15050 [Cyanobacteria bacterium QH_7_48_89]PSO69066.1 MAG: hypothetical protein BRC38_00540 [Cyanobacteria bacterium QH_6_48_35]PSO80872.1 MAG: hypothetical protein BRC41_16625 [Cyanobacteria bacterium QH_9_48_43]PSO92999.1 MAG: hypothetical protein BRC53_15490 [Cyanobacteria bacterium SW_6_48_11]PSP29015.1 MAG: hypothetical protein BRC59_10465 [Cyanobacteria bacterium SW_4_48_29]